MSISNWITKELEGTKISDAYDNSGVSDFVGDIVEGVKKGMESLASGTLSTVLGESIGGIIGDGIKNADLGGLMASALKPMEASLAKARLEILNGFQTFGEEIAKSWNKADQAAYDYAKQVGMTEKQIEKFRDTIVNMSGGVKEIANQYGKTFDELIVLQAKFSEQLGRNVRFTTEQFKNIAAMSGIVGDEVAIKLTAQMEAFGMSTSAAGEMMAKMYSDSVKKGITLQAYSKNVTDNLHLAQQYTFKNGVQGLMSMAENAAKMKMDMQQVVSLSNKLAEGGIEEAVNMSAELQVLGGAFAKFADPLGLLHDSLLGMDDLSDRLTGLIGEMGRFDKKQGRVIIDPFQQMQLRQASKSMGLDYGKLIESATQQAKRKEIEAQMGGLTNIPQEYKELLMNTAQFKDGKAGVTLANGEFKEISELTREELVEIADLEKDLGTDVKEIKKFLIGAEDARKNQEAALENQRAVDNQTAAKEIKNVRQLLGDNTQALQDIIYWQKVAAMHSMLQTVKGLSSTAFGWLGQIAKFIGFANGGMIKTHSDGDLITNGTPGKEYILNSAQYGEFIVNAASTKHHLALLRAINGDKSGQLRFKQYEDGGLVDMGMGFGFGVTPMIPGMGGMGMMGNIYQLQMMTKLNEGIKGITTGSENFIRLNKLISTQQKGLNEMISQRDELWKKFDYRNKLAHNYSMSSAGRELAAEEAAKTQAQITKLQGKIDNTQSRLTKTIDKQRAIASKGVMMRRLATGGMSIMAGVGGYMSAKAQYEATGEAIMNKQKAQAGSVGAGIGAAAGAALGSFAGPIGMMIGSTVGQWLGNTLGEAIGTESKSSMSATRSRLGNEISNAEGSNKFMTIQGEFQTKEQEKIAKALGDGHLYEDELDSDLLTKLRQTGNGNLIEKHARGGWIKGKTHASGGELIGIWEGKIHEAEDSEAIIPADKAKKSVNLVNGVLDGRYNDTSLTPIEPMGKQLKVTEHYAEKDKTTNRMNDTINININGSIKLETDDKEFDISELIFKNGSLLSKITDIITKQLNVNQHFSLNRKEMRNKYSTL